MMKLQLGVLFGGKSVEHDISIITAVQVMKNLDDTLYDIIPLYLDKDNLLLSSPYLKDLKTFQLGVPIDKKRCRVFLYKDQGGYKYRFLHKRCKNGAKIDFILPLVHGMGVEDGTVAGMLEMVGIPYTSAEVGPSALVQDKAWTKDVLKRHGIMCLPFIEVRSETVSDIPFSLPLILKPAHLGSSIGIEIIREYEELPEKISQVLLYDDKAILEPLLTNFREFNCAVLKTNKGYTASEIEEIVVQNTFYAFSDKYEKNQTVELSKITGAGNRQIPAKIPIELKKEIEETTVKIAEVLDLKGIVRIDYLYDKDRENLYVNEINPIPGSLSFYLFEKKGLSFPELLNQLIKSTLIHHYQKQKKITSFSSSVLNKNNLINK